MKQLFALCLFTLILLACSENKTEEVINIDDIGGNTSNYEHIDEPQKIDSFVMEKPTTSVFLAPFDSLFPQATWKKLDSMLFPDRFGPQLSEKWVIHTENDSIIALSYSFKDSLKTRNAFFNWLDCYGKNCDSYQIGSRFKPQKTNSIFFVGEKQLYFFDSQHALPLNTLLTLLEPQKKHQQWRYIIQIPGRKTTNWYSMKDGELKPLKK